MSRLLILMILCTSCGSMIENDLRSEFKPLRARIDRCVQIYIRHLDVAPKVALEICSSIYTRK